MYNNYEYDIMKALYDGKECTIDKIRYKIGSSWDSTHHYKAIDALCISGDVTKTLRARMWYKKTQVIGDKKL